MEETLVVHAFENNGFLLLLMPIAAAYSALMKLLMKFLKLFRKICQGRK